MDEMYYHVMGFTPGEAAEVLEVGVEGLRKYGWTQGVATDEEGRMCLYGAVGYGYRQLHSAPHLRLHDRGHRADVPRVLHKADPDTFPRVDSQAVVGWNDTPGRVQSEVEDMMLKAAKVYRMEQDAIDAGEAS